MYRYLPILFGILILINILIGVLMWGQLASWGWQEHRSPIRAIPIEAQEPTTRKAQSIIVVIISGLNYDNSLELDLPALAQLRQAGASMIVQSSPPSYLQTTWGTLMTGASAELNDAPPYDKPLETIHTLTVDTLFSRAKAMGYQTALFASAPWKSMIPDNQVDFASITYDVTTAGDEALIEAALPIIENEQFEFIVIQLNQLETIAQTSDGPQTEAYQEAALRLDTYLSELRLAIDFSQNVLVVLSDRGHISSGGQGGDESEITRQPLIMVGDIIVPGQYSEIEQVDIAPTLATLLGLAPPIVNQGRILYEVVRLDEREQGLAQLYMAHQRVKLAEAYISVLHDEHVPISEAVEADLTRARKIFSENNINGTFELATLIQKQADDLIWASRAGQLAQEQLWRLLIIGVVTGLWGFGMWQLRGPYTTIILIAALTTFITYHGLYRLQGNSYSISSILSFTELPWEITRRMVVSMLLGSGIILISMFFVNEGRLVTLLSVGYLYSVFLAFLFTVPLLWAFWQNGLYPLWFLPEPQAVFWQVMGLLDVGVIALVGLFLPWPIMIMGLFVSLVRHRLTSTDQQAEAGSVPGLRF